MFNGLQELSKFTWPGAETKRRMNITKKDVISLLRERNAIRAEHARTSVLPALIRSTSTYDNTSTFISMFRFSFEKNTYYEEHAKLDFDLKHQKTIAIIRRTGLFPSSHGEPPIIKTVQAYHFTPKDPMIPWRVATALTPSHWEVFMDAMVLAANTDTSVTMLLRGADGISTNIFAWRVVRQFWPAVGIFFLIRERPNKLRRFKLKHVMWSSIRGQWLLAEDGFLYRKFNLDDMLAVFEGDTKLSSHGASSHGELVAIKHLLAFWESTYLAREQMARRRQGGGGRNADLNPDQREASGDDLDEDSDVS